MLYRRNYLEVTGSSGRVAPPTQILTAEHRYHFVPFHHVTLGGGVGRVGGHSVGPLLMCVCVLESPGK